VKQQDVRLPWKGPPERENEPTTAVSIEWENRRGLTPEKLSAVFQRYRAVQRAIAAANPPPPKESVWSSLGSLLLKGLASVPPDVAKSAIANAGKEWLRKRKGDPNGPKPVLPH